MTTIQKKPETRNDWLPITIDCHDCGASFRETDRISECLRCSDTICAECQARHAVECWKVPGPACLCGHTAADHFALGAPNQSPSPCVRSLCPCADFGYDDRVNVRVGRS